MTPNLKQLAGYKAVDDFVHSDMIIGLGTGTTVFYVIERIGNLLKEGKLKNIVCIATSIDTENKAKNLNIPLCNLTKSQKIDITIDGADEIDNNLNLIKGRGAALVREKIVAINSNFFVVVADESKICEKGLGLTGAVPIEILIFGYEKIIENILKIPALQNCTYKMREKDNNIFISDNNNYIVDLFFTKPIENLEETSKQIKMISGVVDHGIFINMTNIAIISKSDGSILTLKK